MSDEACSVRRQITSLWLRVYFLLFMFYQALALIGVIAWGIANIRTGSSLASMLGVYLMLVVPGGFGVTLVLSIPAAAAWLGVARSMGWPITAPVLTGPSPKRCAGCGYDITGIEGEVCPECGVALRAPSAGDDDEGSGAVR